MPVTATTYTQRSKEDIVDFLEAEMRDEYGEDIDLTNSSAFSTFAEAIAGVDATDIESAIEEVYEAAYIDDAEGDHLEKLVAIIGVSRQSATKATGTVEFRHGETVTQDHSISSGQVVQTDSQNPVEFETTEDVSMYLHDDFESGSLDNDYGGDTGDYSVVDGSAASDPSPEEGSYELKGPTTTNSRIFDTTDETEIGHTFDYHVYLPSGGTNAASGQLFAVQKSNTFYRIVTDAANGDHEIERVVDGSVTNLQTSNVTVPTDEWIRVEVQWLPDDDGTIISSIYQDNDGDNVYDDLVDEIETTNENELEVGGWGFESLANNQNKYWDHTGSRRIRADARALETGGDASVPANTLTVLPIVPSGVNSVTNNHPMGDSDYYLTSLNQFTFGEDEETDAELRERAKVSEGKTAKSTGKAIIAELRDTPNVQSVTVYENDEDTSKTIDGQSIPATSFEAVVYGGTEEDIGETLWDVKGFTARDYGGAHGSKKTHTVEAENGQEFTMEWTEPTEKDVDFTIDIVVDGTYVGDDSLRRDIVAYVGGTNPDETTAFGTGVGENVRIDEVEDRIVGDDNGVLGISSISTTPSTTTDSNGLDVVDIGTNEVAVTDGSDGSISISTTEV